MPLAFGAVVLWHYEPLLVAGLLLMIALTVLGAAPLIRRRQALVHDREAAIARVSGHVADSLTNMETIRAFAAERREADEHRSRVADSRRLTLRSWDYGNLRVDTLVAPMSVLTTCWACWSPSPSAARAREWRRSSSPSPTTPTRPRSCSSSTRSTGVWRAR
ncbi:hypothetical protein GCM10023238_32620 [Streptomyces heliomycini]